jgi:bacteriocin biosynthesis cyclodehydratase domain-containing protein
MTAGTTRGSPADQADQAPLLDPLVESYRLDSENVVLKADQDYLQVRGPAAADLILALDGTTSTSALARRHGTKRVDRLLEALRRRGLLVRGDQPTEWSPSVAIPDVLSTGPTVRWFACALASVIPLPRTDVRIVVADGSDEPELADAARGAPWLLVRVGVGAVWVSQVFAEGRTPCWTCVQTRLLARDDRLALLRHGGFSLLTRAPGPPSASAVCARNCVSAVAAQIRSHVTERRNPFSPGRLVRVSPVADVSVHLVVPMATCAPCRETVRGAGGSALPFVRPGMKYRHAELWPAVRARLGPFLDPVTGVVDEGHVVPATPDNVVAVAVATYANPLPGKVLPITVDTDSGALVRDLATGRAGFGGGFSADDARARAVLEAVERYCTSAQGDELSCRASLADLGDAAVHPNDLMCFDTTQFRTAGRPTRWASGEADPPWRYPEDVKLQWCTAESLTGGERLLPLAYCYRVPYDDPDLAYCAYDSNGSAVGFSKDDAVVSGFLEVVERDAVAIWWYNKIPRPVVDIESFGEDFFAEVAARQRAANSRLSVFDVTSDTGVPTFAAMSVALPGDVPLFGFGAHFDARDALRAALVELGQALCFREQERRKWAGTDWSGQTHLANQGGSPLRAEHYCGTGGTSSAADCVAAAAAVRTEVLVRDCTRADIGLPCVKVVVPGLRGLWPRFGPGRLFEVPVRLGWLAEPRARGDLNAEHLRS